MIGAVSPPTKGELLVLGMDPRCTGRRSAPDSVVPQTDNLDVELTVEENLHVYGRYFGLPKATVRARAAELLDFVQLGDRAADKVEPLSKGMKRRLTRPRADQRAGPDAARRAHHRARPAGPARAVGAALPAQAARGHAGPHTHYMDEAEQLCDRLVVMDKGRIVAEVPVRDLSGGGRRGKVCELRFPLVDGQPGPERYLAELAVVERGAVDRIEALPDQLLLYTADGDAALAAVTAAGIHPLSSLVRRSSLEDVFLRLTGRHPGGLQVTLPVISRRRALSTANG